MNQEKLNELCEQHGFAVADGFTPMVFMKDPDPRAKGNKAAFVYTKLRGAGMKGFSGVMVMESNPGHVYLQGKQIKAPDAGGLSEKAKKLVGLVQQWIEEN